jgi:hypothetical protein
MSLFGKTYVINKGVSKDTQDCLMALAEAVAERFRAVEAQVEELTAEIERLKREPRKTVAQRARERGAA